MRGYAEYSLTHDMEVLRRNYGMMWSQTSDHNTPEEKSLLTKSTATLIIVLDENAE